MFPYPLPMVAALWLPGAVISGRLIMNLPTPGTRSDTNANIEKTNRPTGH